MVIVVVVVCSSCGAKVVQRVEVKGTGVGVSVHASPIPPFQKSWQKKIEIFCARATDQTIFKNTLFLITEQPLIILLSKSYISYF